MTTTAPVILGSPNVPFVPRTEFDRLGTQHLESCWRLVAPSVSRNMRALPLWQVIAAAYAEGLEHGHGIARGG